MAALYWEISYICHRKTLIRDDDYDEIILMGSSTRFGSAV